MCTLLETKRAAIHRKKSALYRLYWLRFFCNKKDRHCGLYKIKARGHRVQSSGAHMQTGLTYNELIAISDYVCYRLVTTMPCSYQWWENITHESRIGSEICANEKVSLVSISKQINGACTTLGSHTCVQFQRFTFVQREDGGKACCSVLAEGGGEADVWSLLGNMCFKEAKLSFLENNLYLD